MILATGYHQNVAGADAVQFGVPLRMKPHGRVDADAVGGNITRLQETVGSLGRTAHPASAQVAGLNAGHLMEPTAARLVSVSRTHTAELCTQSMGCQ